MPLIREIFPHENFYIKKKSTVKKILKIHVMVSNVIPLQNVTKFSWAYVSFLELSDQMTPKNYNIGDDIKKIANS